MEKDIFSQVVEGVYKAFAACDLSIRSSGLKHIFNANLCLTEKALKKEDDDASRKRLEMLEKETI